MLGQFRFREGNALRHHRRGRVMAHITNRATHRAMAKVLSDSSAKLSVGNAVVELHPFSSLLMLNASKVSAGIKHGSVAPTVVSPCQTLVVVWLSVMAAGQVTSSPHVVIRHG